MLASKLIEPFDFMSGAGGVAGEAERVPSPGVAGVPGLHSPQDIGQAGAERKMEDEDE